jgi:general secretion pathway protein M
MIHWFNSLTRKEQLLLLLCSVVVTAYIVFFVVLRPMYRSASTYEARNSVAVESLRNVKALAEEYKSLSVTDVNEGASPKQNLTLIIDKLVKQNELQMKRFQPSSSGDVQLRFESSPFGKILALLNQLESEYGVNIKDLSVSQGSIEGSVDVSIRLSGGT